MAINLSDNIKVSAPKPVESKYLNVTAPYVTIEQVNAAIASGERYTGLTVNILGNEYWYKNSVADIGLILKTADSSSAASGERITKVITKTSHDFAVLDVIGFSGSTYNKSIADGTYDGEILGIVSKCLTADSFELTQAGYVTGLTSLSTNSTYFLSDETAGLLTSTKPSIAGHIVKTVMVADSETSGWVLPYAGFQVVTSSGLTYSTLSEFTITGNSTSTGFTVNHAKNNQFVSVEIVKNTIPYPTIYTNVLRPNANCVCVTFDTPPATGQEYKILITHR